MTPRHQEEDRIKDVAPDAPPPQVETFLVFDNKKSQECGTELHCHCWSCKTKFVTGHLDPEDQLKYLHSLGMKFLHPVQWNVYHKPCRHGIIGGCSIICASRLKVDCSHYKDRDPDTCCLCMLPVYGPCTGPCIWCEKLSPRGTSRSSSETEASGLSESEEESDEDDFRPCAHCDIVQRTYCSEKHRRRYCSGDEEKEAEAKKSDEKNEDYSGSDRWDGNRPIHKDPRRTYRARPSSGPQCSSCCEWTSTTNDSFEDEEAGKAEEEKEKSSLSSNVSSLTHSLTKSSRLTHTPTHADPKRKYVPRWQCSSRCEWTSITNSDADNTADDFEEEIEEDRREEEEEAHQEDSDSTSSLTTSGWTPAHPNPNRKYKKKPKSENQVADKGQGYWTSTSNSCAGYSSLSESSEDEADGPEGRSLEEMHHELVPLLQSAIRYFSGNAPPEPEKKKAARMPVVCSICDSTTCMHYDDDYPPYEKRRSPSPRDDDEDSPSAMPALDAKSPTPAPSEPEQASEEPPDRQKESICTRSQSFTKVDEDDLREIQDICYTTAGQVADMLIKLVEKSALEPEAAHLLIHQHEDSVFASVLYDRLKKYERDKKIASVALEPAPIGIRLLIMCKSLRTLDPTIREQALEISKLHSKIKIPFDIARQRATRMHDLMIQRGVEEKKSIPELMCNYLQISMYSLIEIESILEKFEGVRPFEADDGITPVNGHPDDSGSAQASAHLAKPDPEGTEGTPTKPPRRDLLRKKVHLLQIQSEVGPCALEPRKNDPSRGTPPPTYAEATANLRGFNHTTDEDLPGPLRMAKYLAEELKKDSQRKMQSPPASGKTADASRSEMVTASQSETQKDISAPESVAEKTLQEVSDVVVTFHSKVKDTASSPVVRLAEEALRRLDKSLQTWKSIRQQVESMMPMIPEEEKTQDQEDSETSWTGVTTCSRHLPGTSSEDSVVPWPSIEGPPEPPIVKVPFPIPITERIDFRSLRPPQHGITEEDLRAKPGRPPPSLFDLLQRREPEPAPGDRHLWPKPADTQAALELAEAREKAEKRSQGQRRVANQGRPRFQRGRMLDDYTSHFVDGKSRKPPLGLTSIADDQMSLTATEDSSETNSSGEIAIDTDDMDRYRVDLIVRAVDQSKFSKRKPDGKLQWFAADGRPLNARGLPTFTEEEKRQIQSRDISWDQIPDLTLDRWGRRYIDYPMPPLTDAAQGQLEKEDHQKTPRENDE